MKDTPTPAVWVILAGGVAVLVGSFLDFYELDLGIASASANAWDGDLYFPVTIIPVLCGVVMALQVALTTFADTSLPERILGLGWNQLHLALGFQATLMMVAFLIQDKGGFDIGVGFWLMLLGSIALLVGAILRQREASPAAPPPV
jgi:hypothetical protein